jgi:cobalamin-dependent methionine synthase I
MITKKEVIRYLGYGRHVPDERTMELIDACILEAEKTAVPRITWRRFPLQQKQEDLWIAGMHLQSRNLAANLKDCKEVILMAVTLGAGMDRMMRRYQQLEISKAAVWQAVGAAAVEDVCDAWQADRAKELEAEGLFLRPRYSPGYGDLSLDCQPAFLQLLEAGKRIGVTLSEGGLMIPEKSVTALLGISAVRTGCTAAGCESCSKKACAYRRDQE